MQSQLDKRRRIFKADIRRQHIQCYKQKIRMWHAHQHQHKLNSQFPHHHPFLRSISPIDYLTQNLLVMLSMVSSQICTVHNFELIIESMETSIKIDRQRNFNLKGNWQKRQKLIQIIYRILTKVLDEDNQKVYTVIDQILFLLQYPEMLPLWENLSLLSDSQVKKYSINKFLSVLEDSLAMFDNTFIMDIITNFIVIKPTLPFDLTLNVLAFLHSKQELKPKNLPKINQIGLIITSILKDNDGGNKFYQLIQQGYQQMVINVLCSLASPIKSQCKLKQTSNPFEICFKMNILELFNEMFSCNYEVALYLFSLCPQMMKSLLCCLLVENCQIKEKYKVIVCKKHALLIKNTLITLLTMLNNQRNLLILQTMMNQNGLQVLNQLFTVIELPENQQDFVSESEKQWKDHLERILTLIVNSNIAMSLSQNVSYFGILESFLKSCNLIEDEELVYKVLKLMKITLRNAFIRATQPEIFAQLSGNIIYSKQLRSLLDAIVSKFDGRIYYVSKEILEIATEPKQYLNLH